jgi:hypothetical protein
MQGTSFDRGIASGDTAFEVADRLCRGDAYQLLFPVLQPRPPKDGWRADPKTTVPAWALGVACALYADATTSVGPLVFVDALSIRRIVAALAQTPDPIGGTATLISGLTLLTESNSLGSAKTDFITRAMRELCGGLWEGFT